MAEEVGITFVKNNLQLGVGPYLQHSAAAEMVLVLALPPVWAGQEAHLLSGSR